MSTIEVVFEFELSERYYDSPCTGSFERNLGFLSESKHAGMPDRISDEARILFLRNFRDHYAL